MQFWDFIDYINYSIEAAPKSATGAHISFSSAKM
jgi:hypothetical protein